MQSSVYVLLSTLMLACYHQKISNQLGKWADNIDYIKRDDETDMTDKLESSVTSSKRDKNLHFKKWGK